ncbi:Flp pilus assembly protein CpaB [Corallincola platygyrae]|uniref:Flp pilus assembly protein CpaB n=1 Tax=Corallincola platygyrae TaxID=1193278 RepID=A0ABW4XQI3_9GAMM
MAIKINDNLKSWGLLAAGIILAVIAYFSSQSYLQSEKEELLSNIRKKEAATVEVVVSSKKINAGDFIGASNMAVAKVPAKYLPDSYVSPLEFTQYAGKEMLVDMSRGKPLLKIYAGGEKAGRFSDLIAKGDRPLTLEVDSLESNEEMIEVGDHVDLVLMVKGGENNTVEKLDILAENVNVIATGARRSASTSAQGKTIAPSDFYGYNTITVVLEAELAGQVLLAQENGDLVVMLRNQVDTEELDFEEIAYGATSNVSSGSIQYFAGSLSENGGLITAFVPVISTTDPSKKLKRWQAPVATTEEPEEASLAESK